MYPYSSLVLSVIVSLFCRGSAGIWPFNTFASANLQSADHVKQVAIIGMLRTSIYIFRFRLNTPSSTIDDLACDGSIWIKPSSSGDTILKAVSGPPSISYILERSYWRTWPIPFGLRLFHELANLKALSFWGGFDICIACCLDCLSKSSFHIQPTYSNYCYGHYSLIWKDMSSTNPFLVSIFYYCRMLAHSGICLTHQNADDAKANISHV